MFSPTKQFNSTYKPTDSNKGATRWQLLLFFKTFSNINTDL